VCYSVNVTHLDYARLDTKFDPKPVLMAGPVLLVLAQHVILYLN
jgi:hypothetical protein